MKKIMFNTETGLEQAVFDLYKIKTRRLEGENLKKIAVNETIHSVKFSGSTATLNIRGDMGKGYKMYSYDIEMTTRYKVGDIVAISQSYNTVYSRLPDCEKNSFLARVLKEHQVSNHRDLIAWYNKFYVKAELMPHHVIIEDIGFERLQDISDEDCYCEGVRYAFPGYYVDGMHPKKDNEKTIKNENGTHLVFNTPKEAFKCLIERTCGKDVWEKNPYVVVYKFGLLD